MQSINPELPSNRKFGFFFTFIFLIFGIYLSYNQTALYNYLSFAMASLLFLVSLVKADLLLPLNNLWMRLGLLLGIVVSPIVLGVIFFGLFMPISLFMKLAGRDELGLKLTSRKSYWKKRCGGSPQPEEFKRQF
jgi:hypothetical protein